MHIALHHTGRIPPLEYGGTERVIAHLASALLGLGHQVTLIAKEGSSIAGARVLHHRSSEIRDLLARPDFDLIHYWATPTLLPKDHPPFLVTIGGNGQVGEDFLANTVFVSQKHAELHGSEHYVHNGIDVENYPCDPIRKNHLVFLAKTSWSVKNLPGAIAVARRAQLPLVVIGNKSLLPPALAGLIRRLRPTFNSQVEYQGRLNDGQKQAILRDARGLIFPVRWPEPFGLAVIEALASGCPVYATPYGSLPELVSPEVGHLSIRVSELARQITTRFIAPRVCRTRAMRYFSAQVMAHNYLPYYERILRDGRFSATIPRWRPINSSQTLLPWES